MRYLVLSVLIVGTIGATAAFAAAPAGAPSGSNGLCNDGTYSSSAEKKGACRGHKGVKEWFEGSTAAPSATSTATATTTTAPAAPGAPTMTTRKTSTTSIGTPSGSVSAQAGGSAGQVWTNDSTKVYHCSGDRWYGKTKHGEYMSESDAKAKGFHAAHAKACS